MSTILDAGCLVAVDRGDREVTVKLKERRLRGERLVTHGGVAGQVWRGPRQVALAQMLKVSIVLGLDEKLGRRAGQLLAASGTSDVIDAALVVLSSDGDEILTSDAGDIEHLAQCSGRRLRITPV